MQRFEDLFWRPSADMMKRQAMAKAEAALGEPNTDLVKGISTARSKSIGLPTNKDGHYCP